MMGCLVGFDEEVLLERGFLRKDFSEDVVEVVRVEDESDMVWVCFSEDISMRWGCVSGGLKVVMLVIFRGYKCLWRGC
jgi:hypothetical protein